MEDYTAMRINGLQLLELCINVHKSQNSILSEDKSQKNIGSMVPFIRSSKTIKLKMYRLCIYTYSLQPKKEREN